MRLPRRHMNFACTFRTEYVSTGTKHEENKNIAMLNFFFIFLKTGKVFEINKQPFTVVFKFLKVYNQLHASVPLSYPLKMAENLLLPQYSGLP